MPPRRLRPALLQGRHALARVALLLLGVAPACSREGAHPRAGGSGMDAWTVDWTSRDTPARRVHEVGTATADAQRMFASGFHSVAEQDQHGGWFRWSDGSRSELRLPLIAAEGGRTLVLEGFPLLWAGGPPAQRVEVSLNGRPLVELQWSGPRAHHIDVPDSALRRGDNAVALRYLTAARPCDVLVGSADCRTLAIAWTRVGFLAPAVAPELARAAAGDSARVQPAPSLWWRWTALPPGTRLFARGVAAAGGAEVEVVAHDAGGWHPLHIVRAAAAEAIELDLDVGRGGALTLARLGVLTRRGGVSWQTIQVSVPPPPGARRRPVVLVTLDTTRREALTAFAPARPAPADVALPPPTHRTPALDAVARAGLRFDRAYAPTPATGPSHASMLLSRLPIEHGLTVNGMPMPDAGAGHLANRLQAWGYSTAAFVSLAVIDRHTRFETGFDVFDAEFDQRWWRFADEVNRAAIPWIQQHPQRDQATPGFLWVHYSDPHSPYGLRGDRGRGLVARLDGAVIDTIATASGLPWQMQLELEPGRHVVRWEAPADPGPRHFEQGMDGAWVGLRYAVWSLSVDGEGITWSKGDGFGTHAQEGLRDAAEIRIDVAPRVAPDTRATCALRMVCSDIVSPQLRRERYWQEVATMDRAFGTLWQSLRDAGWLDDAVVLVVGDHGEDLGEEGRWGHLHHVGPTLTRVPLFVWGDGIEPGVSELPVGHVDLATTLIARLGLPADPSWTGADLLASPAARPLYLETFPPDARVHRRSIAHQGYQIGLIMPADGSAPRGVEFFDLQRDPYCRSNLVPIVAGGDPAALAVVQTAVDTSLAAAAWRTLRPSLQLWLAAAPPAERSDDPALLERLRALGYAQ